MIEAKEGELILCPQHASMDYQVIRRLLDLSNDFDPTARRIRGDTLEQHQEDDSRGAGLKFDQGKPRPELLMHGMPVALAQIVDVLTFGAKKYAAHVWRQVENGKGRYTDALYRHLSAYAQGELTDQGSGLPHLAHAATNLLFLMELEQAALTEKQ